MKKFAAAGLAFACLTASGSAPAQSFDYNQWIFCDGYTGNGRGSNEVVTVHFSAHFQADYRRNKQYEAQYRQFLTNMNGKPAYDVGCIFFDTRSEADEEREHRKQYEQRSGIVVRQNGWHP